MSPGVVWYVAVNAAAFGLCAAARSRRTVPHMMMPMLHSPLATALAARAP